MSDNAKRRRSARLKRKIRVRKKITGTDARPRLCVSRSLKFTSVQLITDESNQVLATVSTKQLQADGKSGRSVESAKLVGARIAEIAKEQNIESVTFDRNGYLYHGRIAAVAEGAREAGLKL